MKQLATKTQHLLNQIERRKLITLENEISLREIRDNLITQRNNILDTPRNENVRRVLWLNAESILSVINGEHLLTGDYVGTTKRPNR